MSLVDHAVEVIRRSAVNIPAYKMDLRQAFLDFDTSGDGFLSCEEMVCHHITLIIFLPALLYLFFEDISKKRNNKQESLNRIVYC